jgi:hypothetical protein
MLHYFLKMLFYFSYDCNIFQKKMAWHFVVIVISYEWHLCGERYPCELSKIRREQPPRVTAKAREVPLAFACNVGSRRPAHGKVTCMHWFLTLRCATDGAGTTNLPRAVGRPTVSTHYCAPDMSYSSFLASRLMIRTTRGAMLQEI